MQMYHFVTEWSLPFPIEQVWNTLGDFQSWPAWWPDWKVLKVRGGAAEMQVGAIFDCAVRGSLPYTLRFTMEITRLEQPRLNEHTASGDLAGTGK